uniref:Uncharacterized protein n=1 Tax=Oryza sativa subsp. japonica TaxID=39947 RepID=Q5Z5S3_ORYSJ|nr:hypothetical protein [Oryza sativa Japonica Group]
MARLLVRLCAARHRQRPQPPVIPAEQPIFWYPRTSKAEIPETCSPDRQCTPMSGME